MCGKQVFAVILLFHIVADVANASFMWNFRKLGSSALETISPNPSPAPVFGERSSKDKQFSKTPQKKDEKKANEPSVSNDICDIGEYCKDTWAMVACVQVIDKINKVMVILIQNDGDSNLKANIRTLSLKELMDGIDIPAHHSQKINISLSDFGNPIILNAGSGDCTLHLGPSVSKSNFSELMTPIYGAYFLVLVTIIALSLIACCKLRNRRQDEIPYKELEMHETQVATPAADMEAADGWDQGWDDDWDDDKAVKSPKAQNSGNRRTRPTKTDDWEDWDD